MKTRVRVFFVEFNLEALFDFSWQVSQRAGNLCKAKHLEAMAPAVTTLSFVARSAWVLRACPPLKSERKWETARRKHQMTSIMPILLRSMRCCNSSSTGHSKGAKYRALSARRRHVSLSNNRALAHLLLDIRLAR
jgi:hypothetical protein